MDRFIKGMKAFPFKGMLVIWGIFMLMGAVLFAERSGIHYEGSKSQSAYLSENQIVTEKEAVKELKKTCWSIKWTASRRTASLRGNNLSGFFRI